MKKSLTLISLILSGMTLWAQVYPLVGIDTIQRVTDQDLQLGNDQSYLNGDTVQFEGIVTFAPCTYALSSSGSRIGTFVQKPGGGPWSGIHVLIEPGQLSGYSGTMANLNSATGFLNNFGVGNKVKATGIISGYSGNTQMLLLPVLSTITSISSMPAAKVMPIDSFMQSDGSGGQVIQKFPGEKYEGVYVEFQNVTVVDVSQSGSRWYWSVQDASGNKIRVRDMSGHFRNDNNDDHCNGFGSGQTWTPASFTPPSLGSFLSYIRGIIVEYNGNYYIAPGTLADVGPITAAPPVVSDIKRSPVVPTSSQTVSVDAKIIDPDGTIDTAYLFYSFGYGNTSFTRLGMSAIGNDRFQATIPASGADSTYVNYWFRAIDNTNDTTDFPSTNATSNYYITLDNGIDKISDLQATPGAGGGSIWTGDTLTGMSIKAIVTSTLNTYDLGLVTVQDDVKPWSGIMLRKSTGDGIEQLRRGDSIMITGGVIQENYGLTQLSNVSYSLLGIGNVPAPITGLNADSLRMNASGIAEKYESMFVRFNNAVVIDTNADYSVNLANYGEFLINTNGSASNGLRVDDYSTDIPFGFNEDSISLGQSLGFIQGILYYSFSNFKLLPRNLADIDGFNTIYPKSLNTFAFLGLNPQVFCTIDDQNMTIECTVPFGTDVTSLVPTIDFSGESVDPASGVAQDFTNPVVYTVTAPIDHSKAAYTVTVNIASGVDLLSAYDLQIAPNPAHGMLSLTWENPPQEKWVFDLYDMSGRRLMSQTLLNANGTFTTRVDVSAVPAGVYIVSIGSKLGAITRQLVIE